jgi:hypothetical protein
MAGNQSLHYKRITEQRHGKWRERIKWKNREAYGGAKMCWGTKADRTIMVGDTLAILLAMKSIRKVKGGETYTGTKITLPVDNESAMRNYQTIEHRGDTELLNEANFDLWIAICEEKILEEKIPRCNDQQP